MFLLADLSGRQCYFWYTIWLTLSKCLRTWLGCDEPNTNLTLFSILFSSSRIFEVLDFTSLMFRSNYKRKALGTRLCFAVYRFSSKVNILFNIISNGIVENKKKTQINLQIYSVGRLLPLLRFLPFQISSENFWERGLGIRLSVSSILSRPSLFHQSNN